MAERSVEVSSSGGMEGELRKVALDGAIKACEGVRCSKHGQSASVSEVRQTPSGFEFRLSGCCDDLVERAQRALGS